MERWAYGRHLSSSVTPFDNKVILVLALGTFREQAIAFSRI